MANNIAGPSPRRAKPLRRLLSIVVLVVLGAERPAAAEVKPQGAATVTVGPGVDTNPRRSLGEEAIPDGFLGATASLRGRLTSGDQSVSGRYDGGAKKFLSVTGEDLLAQQLEAGYALNVGALSLGVDGTGKLRRTRAGDRDYTDLSGEAFADWLASRELSLRLAVGLHGFSYLSNADYDSRGPVAALTVKFAPSRKHSFSLGLSASPRRFDAPRRISAEGDLAEERRADWAIGGQLAYALRGPVPIQAGYSLSVNASNSFGESTTRHRLFAAASGKLPLGVIVTGQAALQLNRYPDGIFLSRDLLLADDEAQSSLALKLAYPLGASVDLEARYALYSVALPRTDEVASFLRQTVALGLTFRL